MAILESDLRLLQSVNMADVPEGGGMPSSQPVPDGVSNAVYPDVSSTDRVGGRVRFRKLFAHVNTQNTDLALGMSLTVTQPQDPQISMVLFSNSSVFDTRQQAENRVAAYKFFGTVWHGYLLELHPKGSKQIRLFQIPKSGAPVVGQTLYLVQNEGKQNQFYQYVQITKVKTEEQTFVASLGGKPQSYQAQVVTCDLTARLDYDFTGSPASIFFAKVPEAALTRDTFVSDSGNFKSSTKLAAAGTTGDRVIKLNDIYVQLLPSGRTESQLTGMSPYGQSNAVIQAGGGTVQIVTTQQLGDGGVILVGGAITPATLSLDCALGTMTDKGGQLILNDVVVGSVTYHAGEIRYLKGGAITGTKTIRYKPAAAVLQLADSAMTRVTAENRSFNWTMQLPVVPAKGQAAVSYMAGGRWYTLRDDGSGVMRGDDSSFGLGQVLASTKTMTLNCTIMPDVGSAILCFWGVDTNHYDVTAAAQQTTKQAAVVLPLADMPDLGGITISWTDTEGTHNATANAAGVITGAMAGGGAITGKVDIEAKEILLYPPRISLKGTTYNITYQPKGTVTTLTGVAASFNVDAAGQVTATLGTNITPNTVIIHIDISANTPAAMSGDIGYDNTQPARIKVVDDGSGNIVSHTGSTKGQNVGTINYATGVTVFSSAMQVDFLATVKFKTQECVKRVWRLLDYVCVLQKPVIKTGGRKLHKLDGKATQAHAAAAQATIVKVATAQASKTVSVQATSLRIQLPASIQTGSLRANFGGKLLRESGGQVALGDAGTRSYIGAAA